MILPSDKTYQRTKMILSGEKKMNPDFKLLAEFINNKFNVKVVNIIYDTIDNKKIPRLNICFEFKKEENSFNTDKNEQFSSYDKEKQQIIAAKFKQVVDKEKYCTENVWIIYSAFEPIAKIEANEKTRKDLDELQKELKNKDIWTISSIFTGVTFFLYTDEQVKFYENSPLRKEWTDKYFDILKTYDEFNYFKRDEFNIFLDSKENFDNNYSSNWWYYYK